MIFEVPGPEPPQNWEDHEFVWLPHPSSNGTSKKLPNKACFLSPRFSDLASTPLGTPLAIRSVFARYPKGSDKHTIPLNIYGVRYGALRVYLRS